MSHYLHRMSVVMKPVAEVATPAQRAEDCVAQASRVQRDLIARSTLAGSRVLKPPIG